jgi:hypothetical protein
MIVIGIAVAGGLFYVLKQPSGKTDAPVNPVTGNDGNALRLQAYERLTLLVDRISIPNIISRTGHDGLTAKEMQFVLTKTIRDEFEYNITQQIYVTAEVWSAVKSLKEQNLLTINQIGSTLPANASGLDLNRALLEFLMHDKQANLPELVSAALSYEAKKLM